MKRIALILIACFVMLLVTSCGESIEEKDSVIEDLEHQISILEEDNASLQEENDTLKGNMYGIIDELNSLSAGIENGDYEYLGIAEELFYIIKNYE